MTKNTFPKDKLQRIIPLLAVGIIFVGIMAGSYALYRNQQVQYESQARELTSQTVTVQQQFSESQQLLDTTSQQLASVSSELETLKNEDQVVKNQNLQKEILDIQKTYVQSVSVYEDILALNEDAVKTQEMQASFSAVITALAKRDYVTASGGLNKLQQLISQRKAAIAAAGIVVPPANVPVKNTPPDSGYSRQTVESDAGRFVVDVITADLNSTRVTAVTASEGDCANNCPVDSLASFVAKGGGYAGINGPYFCPAEYPSCAGKTNSFDTLLMNNKKVYFNSDNNVYSSVPAIIFSGNSARVVGASQEWGRDTGVDAVIASQPLLLMNNEVRFGGDGDPKKGSRGSRSFIGVSGSKVYIGVVKGATVAETARVLKAMGVQHALNLDSGGSTALVLNGRYLAGPGRNTPFGIVLSRK